MRSPEREHRLQIIETNYGRAAGWFVEYRGHRVAQLIDPRFEDMFWESYLVEPMTEDPVEREGLLSSRDLWLAGEFVYRSRRFGLVAEDAFSAGHLVSDPGRVLMRSLYLNIGGPSVWERLLLWLRGRLEPAWTA